MEINPRQTSGPWNTQLHTETQLLFLSEQLQSTNYSTTYKRQMMDYSHSNPRLLQDHRQNSSSSPSDNHKVNACSICWKSVNSVTARKLRCKQMFWGYIWFPYKLCRSDSKKRWRNQRCIAAWCQRVSLPRYVTSAFLICIMYHNHFCITSFSHGTQREEELFSFLGQFSFLF